MVASSAQLPQAAAHLLDLNKMTEEGTMEVMRLTEIIQDNRARAAKELAAVVSDIGGRRLSHSSRRVWGRPRASWRRTTSI